MIMNPVAANLVVGANPRQPWEFRNFEELFSNADAPPRARTAPPVRAQTPGLEDVLPYRDMRLDESYAAFYHEQGLNNPQLPTPLEEPLFNNWAYNMLEGRRDQLQGDDVQELISLMQSHGIQDARGARRVGNMNDYHSVAQQMVVDNLSPIDALRAAQMPPRPPSRGMPQPALVPSRSATPTDFAQHSLEPVRYSSPGPHVQVPHGLSQEPFATQPHASTAQMHPGMPAQKPACTDPSLIAAQAVQSHVSTQCASGSPSRPGYPQYTPSYQDPVPQSFYGSPVGGLSPQMHVPQLQTSPSGSGLQIPGSSYPSDQVNSFYGLQAYASQQQQIPAASSLPMQPAAAYHSSSPRILTSDQQQQQQFLQAGLPPSDASLPVSHNGGLPSVPSHFASGSQDFAPMPASTAAMGHAVGGHDTLQRLSGRHMRANSGSALSGGKAEVVSAAGQGLGTVPMVSADGLRLARTRERKPMGSRDGIRRDKMPSVEHGGADPTIYDLKGRILGMAREQHGCRYLQRQLTPDGTESLQLLLDEILGEVGSLMMDPFGNYLVQKVLDICNAEQRQAILDKACETGLSKIACNTHGTRAAQKLVEAICGSREAAQFIAQIQPDCLALIMDGNGNHVIQRCLQKFEATHTLPIHDVVCQNCFEVARHRHGCCVLQRCMDYATAAKKRELVLSVAEYGLELSKNAFGNYVVQYILDTGVVDARDTIFQQLRGQFALLSCQKFSSNVVEKALKLTTIGMEAWREVIVEELVASTDHAGLLMDQFGNYVLQSALKATSGDLHARLVQAIKPHMQSLKTLQHGKRILQQLQGAV